MKKTAKLLIASFLAVAMMFTLTACGGDNNGSGDNVTTADTTNADANPDATTVGGGTGTGEPLPEYEEAFDFAVLSFNSIGVTIPKMGSINVGGNMNQQGGGVIRSVGFQGFPRPTCPAERAEDDECDGECGTCGYDCEEDPDGLWSTLISQNGEFWENISKIQASFFLSGEGVADEIITNVERYMLAGGLLSNAWWQSNINEIEQFSEEYGGNGFEWGLIIDLEWDIDEYKDTVGSNRVIPHNPDGEYIFDRAPININADDPDSDPSYLGAGVGHFGFQMRNEDNNNDVVITVHWTDAVIYVHDMDLFNEHVEMVTETTGRTMSANTAGRVRQA